MIGSSIDVLPADYFRWVICCVAKCCSTGDALRDFGTLVVLSNMLCLKILLP